MRFSSALHLAAAAAIAASALPPAAKAGIGFRAIGGPSHISYGDYNSFVDDMNEEMGDIAELNNINWVPEIGVEAYYTFIPSIDVGIGVGILIGKSDVYFTDENFAFSWEHKMKSVPVTATAYFRPPLPFIKIKPYVYGGMGLYRTSLEFSIRQSLNTDVSGYDADLTDWSFGFHGGAGVEFSVAPTISIDIGFKLRKADVKGFEGTATSIDGESDTVFLRYDDDYGFGPDLLDNKEYRDEGSVDLSGYTFYAGVKFGF